ncbi:hypothetical protein BDM02DRAFT_322138 [Thelephora ganbajun]|uniref:Uncharacterized protein n=1 Tax=Thelephora ganbajun TaxID=370292 RepID=A0ACB6ZQL5_THEGA|nr:hypothetical protein BDM02DRAFT_322138 [Thelephora ganbajun]
MDLPQELIDTIIDNLRNNPASLRACSLVAQSWTSRSQRHLFSAVVIWSDTLHLWHKNISPSSDSVSSYIRDLSLSANEGSRDPRFSPNLLNLAHEHFASIQELESLKLFRWTLVNWECYTRSFGSLSMSLHELQLIQPTSDTTALLSLATFFFRIERIVIISPSILSTDTSNFYPPAGLRLGWKIVHFMSFGGRCAAFLQKLAELPEAFVWEQLTLGLASDVYRLDVFPRLLSSCSATLRTLRIIRIHPDNDTTAHLISGDITLPPLPELREIEFPVVISPLLHGAQLPTEQGSGWLHERLILSITSTRLSVVTMNLERIPGNLLEFGVDWDGVDRAFAAVGRKICAAHANSRLVVRFVTLTLEMRDRLRGMGEEGWMQHFQKVGIIEVVN